ncbi:MAG: hypothetical protein WD875_17870 [Pirellulales bacterium]
MGKAWKRHIDRIFAQGLYKSVFYYVVTVGFDRIGIRCTHCFKHAGLLNLVPRDPERTFGSVASMSDWTERDLDVLCAYGGDALLADFQAAFSRRETCVVARVACDGVACVCWLTNNNRYIFSKESPCWIIQRCFTMPAHRGKRLYPQTLAYACELIRRECDDESPIFIECSAFNYSSIRGIRKAGFLLAGKVFEVCGRKVYRRAYATD